MTTALDAAITSLKTTSSLKPIDLTNDKSVACARNFFVENAALNITRHSSAALNMPENQLLRHALCLLNPDATLHVVVRLTQDN